MAIRDNDSLAYAAGTYTPSDRVYSFIWVYAAQTDASIRSFNIETNKHALDRQINDFLHTHANIASIIKNTLTYSYLPIDNFKWITGGTRQLKWIEKYISDPDLLKNLPSYLNPALCQNNTSQYQSINYSNFPKFLSGISRGIAILDYWMANTFHDVDIKIYFLDKICKAWLAQEKIDRQFDWIDDENASLKKEIFQNLAKSKKLGGSWSNQSISDHVDFLTYVDELVATDYEKTSINRDARNRWNQQVRREKEKHTKKQCNFNLPIGIDQKLSALAEKHELSRAEIIEILVRYESRKNIYINEWLQRKPTHDILQK